MAGRKKKEDWWKQYSYTRPELIRRVIILIVLVYAFLNYRGFFIAATVNNQPIARLSVVLEAEKQLGSQTLENLISEVLIKQKARDLHIEVTQESVDARVAELEETLTVEGQSLEDILALSGTNREQFEDQIKTQLIVEKLLEGDVNVSDEEVNQYIEENADFLPVDLEEAELRDVARDQLRQQKLGARFGTWMSEVRSESDITYFVDY